MLRLLAFRGLLGPGDPAELAAEALRQDRASLQLRHLRSADGARLSEVTSLPMPGGGFVLCSVDITALHRAAARMPDPGQPAGRHAVLSLQTRVALLQLYLRLGPPMQAYTFFLQDKKIQAAPGDSKRRSNNGS